MNGRFRSAVVPLAAALGILVLAAPLQSSADGMVSVDRTDGTNKTYPGLQVINTQNTVYFRNVEAHQTLVVAKGSCSSESGVQVCVVSTVSWDRYGVRQPIDLDHGYVYINSTRSWLRIQGSRVTLGPNTLQAEIATKAGTSITALGFVDTTVSPWGEAQ